MVHKRSWQKPGNIDATSTDGNLKPSGEASKSLSSLSLSLPSKGHNLLLCVCFRILFDIFSIFFHQYSSRSIEFQLITISSKLRSSEEINQQPRRKIPAGRSEYQFSILYLGSSTIE